MNDKKKVFHKLKLRELELKDSIGMLEWMSDSSINELMHFKKNGISKEQIEKFILSAQDVEKNLHLAIVDSNDEYLGTVSLKNIDHINQNAEFAIAIRTCAMGKGISKFAVSEILKIAFEQLKLHKVYFYVRSDNLRAIKFYEKSKFYREGIFKEHDFDGEKYHDLIWYRILDSEQF